jgi:hydrogenase expression/formation protein HypD
MPPLAKLDEFRDPRRASGLASQIASIFSQLGRPITLMEVCGTHTVSIFRWGIPNLLPDGLRLISGPGCPVCVTPNDDIDWTIEASRRSDVTLVTFGDMVRVPASRSSLAEERARGADVRVVYSPFDSLGVAEDNPERQVVFFGVGFETTSPGVAATLLEAKSKRLANWSLLCAHKVLPPALDALLSDTDLGLDGLILPGHVSVIIGSQAYQPLVAKYGIPSVVAGFEPTDVLQAVWMLLKQIRGGEARLESQYTRAVKPEGNQAAQQKLAEAFRPCDSAWRGMGTIPGSGFCVQGALKDLDAKNRLELETEPAQEPPGCRCGEVICGKIQPEECSLFGSECTPARPIGACMVSSEGTCATHFRYASGQASRVSGRTSRA